MMILLGTGGLMFRLLILAFFVSFSFVQKSMAVNFYTELYQGARSKGMGGAYVGLADDQQTLFYNPAGLAGVKRSTLQYVDTMFEASTDSYAVYKNSFSSLSGFSISTLNALQGYNTYLRAQTVPMFLMQNFGFGFVFDQQFAYFSKNLSLPNITMGYQTTMGIQAGFGLNLSSRRIRPGRPLLRLGASFKALWRRGGYIEIPQSTLLGLSGTTGLITTLFGNFGFGLGMDIGAHYIMPMSRRVTFSFGTAFTDIGDTSFSSQASAQKGNLSAGFALKYKSGVTGFTFAYDMRNILESTDWRKKNHIGMELGLSFLDIYLGVNQAYLTYGVGVDVWIMKIKAISYAEELGASLFQDSNRRYMLKIEAKVRL